MVVSLVEGVSSGTQIQCNCIGEVLEISDRELFQHRRPPAQSILVSAE